MCFGGGSGGLGHWSALVRLCIIYVRVWVCTHGILCYRPRHPAFLRSLLSNETPTLFLHQAYLAQPFILARSSVRQKETSAQWENALIIHDHLTIQDLVCAAYVAFLISARQPHLLMAVSLLLFCILYLQIITTQQAIILFCLAVVGYYNSRQNISVFVERRWGWCVFSSLIFSLVCFLVICCGLNVYSQTCVTSPRYLYC